MTREYYKHHVFLSYSRQDTEMMYRVRDGLRAAGLLVWTDDTGLEPGTPSWEAAIQEAIREAGCMVVLLSPDAMDSEWVTRESAFAATWDLRIFPVLVRGNERSAVPLRLTSHQRIDARRDVDAAMRALVASILRHLTVEPLATLHTPPRPVRSRRGLPLWAWLGGAAGAFILCAAVVIGGLALSGAFGGGGDVVEGPGSTPYEIPGRTPDGAPTPEPTHEDQTTPSATPDVGPVTRNADWEPIIRHFNGVQMALVPSGCFLMGSVEDSALELCGTYYGDCEREWFEDEAPQHAVCFDEPYWIDVVEVSNAQYGSSGEWSGSNLPRETVSWFDAVAHCDSRGARLPTEAEWEYAARGPDGLGFPWGDAFDGSLVNYCDSNCRYEWADASSSDGYQNTAPVGSYPGGVSWVGAYDLSGNVWEWVSDWYGPYPSAAQVNPSGPNSGDGRALRGGSLLNHAPAARGTSRDEQNPDFTGNNLGFRCARDVAPADLTP